MSIGTTERLLLAALALFQVADWVGFPSDARADATRSHAAAVEAQTDVPTMDRSPRAWWTGTLDNLLRGVELSAHQQAGVEAILDEAATDRARARKLREVVVRTRDGAHSEREQSARAELKQLRKRLSPAHRIDAMAELLDPEQREIFDRNRRLRSDRLFKRQRAARSAPRRSVGNESGEEPAADPVSPGPKPLDP